MKLETQIYSVFGQIQGVIADAMAAEGKVHKIPTEQIPYSVRWNDAGEQALCAIVLTPATEVEFNRRVKELTQ